MRPLPLFFPLRVTILLRWLGAGKCVPDAQDVCLERGHVLENLIWQYNEQATDLFLEAHQEFERGFLFGFCFVFVSSFFLLVWSFC